VTVTEVEIEPWPLPHTTLLAVSELFAATFSAPPRDEAWNSDEVMATLSSQGTPADRWHLVWERQTGALLGFALSYSSKDRWIAPVLVGFGLAPTQCYLAELAVSERARGRGIGTELVNAVLREASAVGLGVAARCRADAAAVRSLFGKLGFRCVGTYEPSEARGTPARRCIYHAPLVPAQTGSNHAITSQSSQPLHSSPTEDSRDRAS
jgi:ribosomal protein S18 acetylase RimI-like enzyme